MSKSYEPQLFENDIYSFWEENACFDAADENAVGQKPFCIVVPPPNVTGVLHMGHALTLTIQDILVRWRRMKGDNTLWLPGTDHAGIATQAQVEKAIAKESKNSAGRPLSRYDLGREGFVARVWKWKEEHGNQISNQERRLGASLDWRRERFTMDEGLSAAVREVFVRLYEEKLIYRGERIINWCVRCQTALSDLEVIPVERKGRFWHLAYKIVNEDGSPVLNSDGSEAQLVIATTRPETLLGDTAVAVHPEDERYKHLQGKKVLLPLLKRVIPIIFDAYVDKEFGSGALKVTPAHDFNDYEIGKRHNLPAVSVMGKDGKITPAGGPYAGLRFDEARERVIQDLKEEGLLIKSEEYTHKVGVCQRCESTVEPIISKQWFVKIEPLATPAIEAVKNGSITFTPKSWEKVYFEWMNNIRDWCISRQLWWGHQIPAWYCGRCQEVIVSRENPTHCVRCSAPEAELRRDEDVLDTWFSSALWPFSTIGWPEKTKALQTFYPTSIMETGFDIIFFWVARMIMMGLHFMKDVPFKQVYLHAMVRDEKGEKMSKSKGNVIDPLVVVNQHGADPLRFTLAAMAGQGRDIKLSLDRVEGYRAFCNKLWNAVKFLHLQLDAADKKALSEPTGGTKKWLEDNRPILLVTNKWIISRLQGVCSQVEKGLVNFEINESAQTLYEFTWHELCDWFIEFSKLPLKESDDLRKQTVITLHYVLEEVLRLLHPFMPFVTEKLWQSLPWKTANSTHARKRQGRNDIYSLMVQPFPAPDSALLDQESEKTVQALKTIVEAIRNFRGENNISPKIEFAVNYVAGSSAADIFVRAYALDIKSLTRIAGIQATTSSSPVSPTETTIPIAQPPLELRIDLKGLVNVEEENKRINKELEKVRDDLEFIRKKLARESFVAKAPPELVTKERARERELIARIAELEQSIVRLKGF